MPKHLSRLPHGMLCVAFDGGSRLPEPKIKHRGRAMMQYESSALEDVIMVVLIQPYWPGMYRTGL
jgi:hypothetical protein